MKICKYEGCGRKHEARGYCKKHYGRLLATGSPAPSAEAHGDLETRFWRKVDKSGECWIWTGAKMQNGYGRLRIGGKGSPVWNAHRVSYQLNKGEIPEGAVVMHTCDNPSCVRPEHLRIGTHRDNMIDMITKGRNVPNGLIGTKQHNALLDDDKVREIRKDKFVSDREMAERMGVSISTIRDVRRGRRWTHVK